MRPAYRFRKNPKVIAAWLLTALALIALLWTALYSILERDKEIVRKTAFQRSTALSKAYTKQLTHMVDQIDQITLNTQHYWRGMHGGINLEQQVREGIYPPSAMLYVTIADRDGRYATSTLPFNPALDVSGRDWFRIHKQGKAEGLMITGPTVGLQTGRPIIHFSRRLKDAKGVFDGVVSVSVSPDYVTTFEDDSMVEKGDFVSVRLASGPLLATKVGAAEPVRTFYRTSPVFLESSGAVFEPKEKFDDGEGRIVAWHKLEKYPLVALAAQTNSQVYAGYHQRAENYKSVAAVLSALIVFFCTAGAGTMMRRDLRKRHEEDVRNTYRLAVDNAQEGFFMVRPVFSADRSVLDYRIEDCNRRGAAMMGRQANVLVGKNIEQVLDRKLACELQSLFSRALASGFYEDEYRVPAGSPVKAPWLHRRFVRAGGGIALTVRDISEAKAHEQALSSLANTDTLTNLPNRNWLNGYLPVAVSQAEQESGQLALLFIDLDNFKNINDTLGHEAGDILLKEAAHRLKSAVRAHDHVVRLGGDEFIVILEEVDLVDSISRIADSLVKSVSQPFTLLGIGGNRVAASVGIALFPTDGTDAKTLLKHADVAMYAAKAAGKGRHQFYQSHLSDSLILKLSKEAGLRQAIERDEFVLHYQPRVGTRTGKIASMEALLRWNHPERGLVLPMEFIDVAEDAGLIVKIGEIVIEKACAQQAQWRAEGMSLVPVSVNVSGLQLRNGSLSSFLDDSIRRHRISSQLIEVELTESTMIGKDKSVAHELKTIRGSGIKLLIDDFGTGYSSLAQLQELDVDILKIDKAFTDALCDGEGGKAFFKAIVQMSNALDICIVAEGVETAEQVRLLQALDCEEMQGHFVSQAVPAAEMALLLMKRFLFPSSMPHLTVVRT
jgi:diguanylate cyclase (GGDEF)-like protein